MDNQAALKDIAEPRQCRQVFSKNAEQEQTHGFERKWFALYVKSRSEFVTERELKSKGIETFLPKVKRPRQWKDRKKLVEFPLFPGYLFFQVAAGYERFHPVLKTKGAVTILSRKPGFPTPVPDREIESLKAVVANEEIIDIYPHLKEGMQVRVRRGLLAGAEGVLQSREDHYLLMVNIELLGRSVAVRILAEDVEPV
jgi:transcription antitermination factor NusG